MDWPTGWKATFEYRSTKHRVTLTVPARAAAPLRVYRSRWTNYISMAQVRVPLTRGTRRDYVYIVGLSDYWRGNEFVPIEVPCLLSPAPPGSFTFTQYYLDGSQR